MGLTRGRAALLAGAVLSAGGCGTFPIRLYVPPAALQELARTRYEPCPGRGVLRERIRARLGFEGEPVRLVGRFFHRLDRPPHEPLRAVDLASVDSPWAADLRPGDLVLAKNAKAQSLGSALALARFAYYDHVGVLIESRGRWRVCESWPTVRLLGSSPDFAARFQGEVDDVPLERFMKRYEVLEFVRLPDEAKNRLLARGARASLAEGIVFDPYHDPDRPEKSCSEYVRDLLVEEAGYAAHAVLTPATDNASMRRLMEALGFHAAAYLEPDDLARYPGAERVAWVARHATPAQATALRAAYQLFHRRFEAGGRAGDYLDVDPFHLVRYDASARAFLEWTKGYFGARPTEDPAEIERVLQALFEACFVPRAGA